MRHFIITYEPINKYGKTIQRSNKVTVSKTTGDIGKDAKAALEIFIRSFGNLKKNEVFSIQEVNAEGKSIGEPILPTSENSIIPTGR